MPTFILTGNYESSAIRGMIASPSDREAAARALIEAAGGKLLHFYLTSGDRDFMVISEAPSMQDLLPSLMAVGASGQISHMRTVQAFTAAEFKAAQEKAKAIAAAYKPPA
ncbi:GYD domain-containing protein [Defluviimonas sp. D31]|uniref:GYD domain-containing protein n=1 Tax=Defluviimonas sp. D31 TaxID=3083253 RepID=UPI00296FD5A0|nr:GYD domain-containing protein [Defluviimonas sp. D31]MDW4548334.1 GYD domain-containing protein [Defluviimonas sp. D31]